MVRAAGAQRFGQGLAAVHGIYYFATGLWPLVHLQSFIAVTGPKEDLWLVQTVGVLVLVIGATLLAAALFEEVQFTLRILAVGSAAGFLGVDVVFWWMGQIPAVYLLDAVAQLVLLAAWIGFWITETRTTPRAAA